MHNIWDRFAQDEELSSKQLEQFQTYATLLKKWNERINLTALTDDADIVQYHFQDSLRIADVIDCTVPYTIADIGSGAGFPGIPLKIKFPNLTIVLIEVLNKRVAFLQEVIDKLALEGVVISSDDWRTFIRRADHQVDIFCARASLAPAELLRALRPGSAYNDALIVYYASRHWKPDPKEESFIRATKIYQVGEKQRQLVLFGHERAQRLIRVDR